MSYRQFTQWRWSGCVVSMLALAFMLTLGVVDYHTGPEFDFGVFYLVPVGLTAWFGSVRQAVAMALLGGIVWAHADLLFLLPGPIMVWRTVAGAVTNLLVAIALRRLRTVQNQRQQMLRYVVHDLRTPLTSLIASLGGLQLTAQTGAPSDTALVAGSLASARRLLTMVNSLLDLAQLQAGQLRPDLRPVTAADLVAAARADIDPWAAAERLTVIVADGLPDARLLADAELTTRVLVNLLGNAIKYSPRHGRIALGAHTAPGRLVFTVSDEGSGIPEDWRERIFDPFAKVTGNDRPAGAGLGLAFARQVVEAQDGEIWVDEPTLGGTTIAFSLPAL
ncbi:MAG: hypothetical protein HZB16_20625 [Armatimonadetes bacterium]|nr:hypothetical protein [Armatimonadota bacterium]